MLDDPTFWVAVSFVIFLALVLWKGIKPVLAALDQRSERIREELDEAQTLREEAQKTLADYKRKQRDAVAESEAIVTHAKAEATRMREQAEKDLAHALERREQAALEKIAQAEAKALQEVRNQAVDIAIAATSKLLSEQLDATKSEALMAKSIDEISGKLN